MGSRVASREELIAVLVSSESGYRLVALGDRLSIFKLDNSNGGRQFAVALDDEDGNELDERSFARAIEAAVFFETQRKRMRMGFEFEGGWAP